MRCSPVSGSVPRVVDEAAQQRADVGVVQPELVDERVQLVAVAPRGDGRAVGARNGYETHRRSCGTVVM